MKCIGGLPRRWLMPVLLLLTIALAGACSSGEPERVFYIAGIPDQDVSLLEARFDGLAEYLSDETGLTVRYIPSIDYASVVTAFKQGDIQMAWYGGLTGVQARLAAPGARAIAQRPRDEAFHSVFIAPPGLGLTSLTDVGGRSIIFGSDNSTSGHLMPRYFLTEAGVDLKREMDGPPSYSGSHDKTWKFVETGAFEVGAMNEAVWEARVAAGVIDTQKVQVFFVTPPYHDYHWVIRGDVNEKYGRGVTERIVSALLRVDSTQGDRERKIADAFQTDRFIRTSNRNYLAIERIARQLGIIEE